LKTPNLFEFSYLLEVPQLPKLPRADDENHHSHDHNHNHDHNRRGMPLVMSTLSVSSLTPTGPPMLRMPRMLRVDDEHMKTATLPFNRHQVGYLFVLLLHLALLEQPFFS